ncbi:hypothetical protein CODIS_24070 [Candidatus Thiodiazotropha endolucinida]|uniref:Uncharacterized protein n=1 Tax=Candidatus Thiodiazotropha endolucinida TaxID=1655433 RepID=A0A7Z1AF21_9GAMM|nr:hypothetical protein CODIS_24070 [Candidatus Thiodiazotropha endolucinida]
MKIKSKRMRKSNSSKVLSEAVGAGRYFYQHLSVSKSVTLCYGSSS